MTILEKKYNVAYKKDSCGKCIDVMEVKVVGKEQYQQLLKESNYIKEVARQDKEESSKAQQKEFQNVYKEQTIQDLFIAKGYFDNLCDRGICETNDEFESMFYQFVDKGIMFDLHSEFIPPHYLKVLERLGYVL